MRAIKFRYTCKRENGHTFSGIFTLEQIESSEVRQWWELNHVGKSILSKDQYTGLKDKNGKEGYFDDLVKWGKAIYKVVWNIDDGIAGLQYVSGKEVFKYLPIKEIKTGEVIGNI